MRWFLLLVLLVGRSAVAQTIPPLEAEPRMTTLADVYAAADDDALPAPDLAALTPEAALEEVWTGALFTASLLASALQMSGDPSALPLNPGERAVLRASLGVGALPATASVGALLTAVQLQLAYAPPEQRPALQTALRDADALRLLLGETAEEMVLAAFASDDGLDAALAGFGARGALLLDVTARLQSATAVDP